MNKADSEIDLAPPKRLAWRKPLMVVAGIGLLDIVLSLSLGPPVREPSVNGFVMLALVSSQLTLLAQWFALAGVPWSSRLLSLVIGLGLLSAVMLRPTMSDSLLPTLLLIFLPQVGSLLLARWAGWRIQHGDLHENQLMPWQFSLWQGIATLTAFSILFGATRVFYGSKLLDDTARAFLAINLSLTICSLWAGMGNGRAGLRIPLAFLVGNLLCYGLIILIIISENDWSLRGLGLIRWWSVAVIVNFQLLLIVGPLLVLRRFGYRFERIGRSNKPLE